MFGKDDIDITISHVHEDNVPAYQISMKLVYIHSQNMDLKNRPQQSASNTSSQVKPDSFHIVCLLKDALQDMSTIVNKCFQENFQKPPIEAVKKIQSQFLPGMTTDIKSGDSNTIPLPKTFIVPRMAFSNFVRFINKNEMGGIYNSPMVAFRGVDNFSMWSIKWAIEQNPYYTIHLLPSSFVSNGDGNKVLEKTTNSETEFYTRIPISTKFSGQKDVIASGGKVVTTVLPSNGLYSRMTLDIDTIMKDNAPRVADPTFQHLNPTVRGIEKYQVTSGNETNDNFIRLKMANSIHRSSEIMLQLSRNIVIKRLLQPGVAMELKTYSEDYNTYNGKYITLATDIVFDRRQSEVYNCTAKIRSARSNLKI
jgi:hypothetical protein